MFHASTHFLPQLPPPKLHRRWPKKPRQIARPQIAWQSGRVKGVNKGPLVDRISTPWARYRFEGWTCAFGSNSFRKWNWTRVACRDCRSHPKIWMEDHSAVLYQRWIAVTLWGSPEWKTSRLWQLIWIELGAKPTRDLNPKFPRFDPVPHCRFAYRHDDVIWEPERLWWHSNYVPPPTQPVYLYCSKHFPLSVNPTTNLAGICFRKNPWIHYFPHSKLLPRQTDQNIKWFKFKVYLGATMKARLQLLCPRFNWSGQHHLPLSKSQDGQWQIERVSDMT